MGLEVEEEKKRPKNDGRCKVKARSTTQAERGVGEVLAAYEQP